jgi:hypothetical protein
LLVSCNKLDDRDFIKGLQVQGLAEGCITQKKRTRFGDFQNPSGIFRDFHVFLGIFEGFQIKKIPEKNQQLHKNFTFTLVLYHY